MQATRKSHSAEREGRSISTARSRWRYWLKLRPTCVHNAASACHAANENQLDMFTYL